MFQTKMICSFKEGEIHFKYNVFEGFERLKRYISSVTVEIYLPDFSFIFYFENY